MINFIIISFLIFVCCTCTTIDRSRLESRKDLTLTVANGTVRCNGVLVSERIVLTAKHCLMGNKTIKVVSSKNKVHIGRKTLPWFDDFDLGAIVLNSPILDHLKLENIVDQTKPEFAKISNNSTSTVKMIASSKLYVLGKSSEKVFLGDSGSPIFQNNGLVGITIKGDTEKNIVAFVRLDSHESNIFLLELVDENDLVICGVNLEG